MKAIHYQIALATLLVIGSLLPIAVPPARAATAKLVVVVAAATGLRDISTATLRRAFMGYPTDVSGKRLIPLNQPTATPNRVVFDQVMLGLTAEEVGRFWVDRRIRDESPPPKTIPSAELAVKVAASLPGAITYISEDLLNEKVVALTIDGKSHKDGGYLLK
jgi:type II secretory pathway pseudopilin PulG